MNTEQNLKQKLDAIKGLKIKIRANITDEDEAARSYAEQARLAQKVGKASIEYALKDISIQEAKHAESNRRIIRELDQEESKTTTQADSDRRKKEDEGRRKRESEPKKGDKPDWWKLGYVKRDRGINGRS